MKARIAIVSCLLSAISLAAAETTLKEDISAAAKALGEKSNYSWRTTMTVPQESPLKPGPIDGQTEKEGFTLVNMSLFDNQMQAVVKGEKGAITLEGSWKSLEEIDKEEGPARFLGMLVRGIKTPAAEAAELASYTQELKKEGDAYSSVLTEEGAKKMQSFGATGGPISLSVSEAQGSVKFWTKDGLITKYEFKLKGKISINGNDFPNERTTSVEIKKVGSTKVEIPAEAKRKITG